MRTQISNNFKALPLPKNLKTITLEEIENKRKKRIKSLKKELLERAEKEHKAFTLETEKRPTNIDKIRNMVEKNIEEKLNFKGDVRNNEGDI